MCHACYRKFGEPTIISEKTLQLANLIEQVYQFSDVGGNLHIELDDWNIGDEYIQRDFEVFREDATPEQIKVEQRCHAFLKECTEAERASALAIYEGFLKPTVLP